jgi:hypothetical protein
MSGGSFATVADAVARQNYMWKQMMGQRAPRARVKHLEGPRGGLEALAAEEWEPYDCLLLCLRCGYLDEDDGEPCPGCGNDKWVDLRRTVDADAIRQMERRNRSAVPPRLRQWGQALSAAIGLGVGALLLAYFLHDPYTQRYEAWLLAVGVGAFVGGVGAWLLPKALSFLVYRRRPVYPLRWRLPLPLPDRRAPVARRLEGPLEPRGELLVAPLSGRPCVGYEVRALFDAVGDARPPMWILEEERVAPFAIDGHEVAADGATLQIETQALDEETLELDDEKITRFLRKRGLFAAEGTYTLYEAILEPGRSYRLERSDRPPGAVPRLVDAP